MCSLSKPYNELPMQVERLDSSSKNRKTMSKMVISLRNPIRLLLGSFRASKPRRSWLIKRLRSLPVKRNYVYILHYWDSLGHRISILTKNPKRGVQPPPRYRKLGCPSNILAAFCDQMNITKEIKAISASFHPEEHLSFSDIRVYMQHRRGIDIKSHPIIVTDSTLIYRSYSHDNIVSISDERQ